MSRSKTKRRHRLLVAAMQEARFPAIDPVRDRQWDYGPTFTLDRWIAEGRAEMGEERWAELNAEWEQ